MKLSFVIATFILSQSLYASDPDSLSWIKKQHVQYNLYYTTADSSLVSWLENDLEKAVKTATSFFSIAFKKKFDVYIFPTREQLTLQWRKDWGVPDFEAQCWMVASGIATRLDILSPRTWKKDACDHNPNDSIETRQIITHELVHVLHAQHNPKPAFAGMEALDWLVEGLATYASGQLSGRRINNIINQIKEGSGPQNLSDLWTGADKYGRAGSFMRFLDQYYGREKLTGLLAFTDLHSILKYLGTDELTLIRLWKKSLLQ